MSGLPKQVREQVKRSDSIAKAMGLDGVPEGTPDLVDVTAVSTMSLEEGETNAMPLQLAVAPKAEDPALADPPADSGHDPDPAPADPPADPEPPADVDWQHKYKVLQGKYDAEVPRLSSELNDAQARISTLESVIASMQTEPEPEPANEPDGFKYLNDDEIEDYGTELIDVMKRAAKEAVADEISQLRDENARLRDQLVNVGTTVAQTERERFYSELDKTVPKWREINSKQEFLSWLAELDPFTGSKRHDLLSAAFNDGDVSRVAAFFNGYIGEHAAVSTPAEDSATNSAQLDLGQLVAPGTPKDSGAAQSAPSEKPIFSRQQIAAFYKDVQLGKYNNKPEEQQRMEAAIFDATREGRIR